MPSRRYHLLWRFSSRGKWQPLGLSSRSMAAEMQSIASIALMMQCPHFDAVTLSRSSPLQQHTTYSIGGLHPSTLLIRVQNLGLWGEEVPSFARMAAFAVEHRRRLMRAYWRSLRCIETWMQGNRQPWIAEVSRANATSNDHQNRLPLFPCGAPGAYYVPFIHHVLSVLLSICRII